MNKNAFPLIASGIGVVLALVLARSGVDVSNNEPLLPPLTQLFISEFGFLVTAAGAWFGGRAWFAEPGQLGMLLAVLGCLALAMAFLTIGLALWDGIASS